MAATRGREGEHKDPSLTLDHIVTCCHREGFFVHICVAWLFFSCLQLESKIKKRVLVKGNQAHSQYPTGDFSTKAPRLNWRMTFVSRMSMSGVGRG